MKAELFILNYNGAAYIANTIRTMLISVARSSYPCHLTVIDNVSTDESVALIRERFPSIQTNRMKENRVLCSFNEAVKQSEADIVFLLNNDLTADPDFIDPLINTFLEKKDAFMTAAKSFLPDHSYEGGRSIPFVKYGMFGTTCRFKGFENRVDRLGITFSAGFGAFDRRRFLALGGFDDLYLPGRLEDADIALRAWRLGWKCYYEPRSILYHDGAKSFKARFGTRGTLEIAHRNTFLFIWKNVHDPKYWIHHWLFLIPRLLWSLGRGRFEFITGFIQALFKMRHAFSKRQSEINMPYVYTDREIITLFQHGR